MEVLGAVASSIAVLQALAAGKHVISIAREVSDFQNDFDHLMKELTLVKSMAKAIARMPPSTYEQGLIDAATEDLNEVTKELETLLRCCSRKVETKDSKTFKTKKRKWLLERSTIQKLQQRMKNAKDTLHFAVTSSRATNDAQFQAELRQMLVNLHSSHTVDNDTSGASPENSSVQYHLTNKSESSARGTTSTTDRGDKAQIGDLALYTAIETLLDVWESILPEVGLSRYVVCLVHDELLNKDLDDHKVYLLQKLTKIAGVCIEETTTSLHNAIRQGKDLQFALDEQPWAIDIADATGHSPLTLATETNQVDCMKVLISAGANPNHLLPDGSSALMIAAKSGCPESVRLLLKAKCRVDCADSYGTTALHMASRACCPQSVSFLLAAGSSATSRDNYGNTPLHDFATTREANCDKLIQVLEILIMAGADIQAKNSYGRTPIMTSVFHGNVAAMKCLFEAGGSFSMCHGPYDQNSLHLAARHASLDMLEYLDSLSLAEIDPYQMDTWANTSWDHFMMSLTDYHLRVPGYPKRGNAETQAFVKLYQGVKERYLRPDIASLGQVVKGLQARDATTARQSLLPLLAKKRGETHASWYRAVDKRIQHLEWDLATEDVEEYLMELKEELDTPVWKIPSRHGRIDQGPSGEFEFRRH
ncbi:ankyrin ph and sec7 domain containing secg [Fusarium longipes]|uniref:Ankyrin ph and sec7 domain containing secg n=1 Tax=Fusarium longipes TaxID=694270 RepID=A0A395T6W3_9HYPO|nr:ankyrin ph and sec7 domain containing secg [Fusarium longipes]